MISPNLKTFNLVLNVLPHQKEQKNPKNTPPQKKKPNTPEKQKNPSTTPENIILLEQNASVDAFQRGMSIQISIILNLTHNISDRRIFQHRFVCVWYDGHLKAHNWFLWAYFVTCSIDLYVCMCIRVLQTPYKKNIETSPTEETVWGDELDIG